MPPTEAGRLDREDFAWACILGLAIALIDVSFLSKTFVIEGLARAIPMELGRVRSLFLGSYFLYGPVGYASFLLARLLGYKGLAVEILQLLDVACGAAGIGLNFLTLRCMGADRRSAGVWSAILGFSLGYWRWSVEAENYIFSAFLLQLNFFVLIRYFRRGKGSPALLGALQALAMMGHIVNSLFSAVGLWILYSVHQRDWRRPALIYLGTGLGVCALTFGPALAILVRPADLRELVFWFLGSAGAGGSFRWHGGLHLAGCWQWLKMTLNIFTSFEPDFHRPPMLKLSSAALWVSRGLISLFALNLALRIKQLRRGRPLMIACGLWVAAYACVFTSWEPATMVYRISDLIPIIFALYLGYQAAYDSGFRTLWLGAALALAASLAVGNFGAEIHPRSLESNNIHLARMKLIRSHSADGDWVAANGGIDPIYVPYFAQRRPLLVDYYLAEPEKLRVLVEGLVKSGQNIFVTSQVLEDPVLGGIFRKYKPRLEARSEGFALYELRRP